jgi:hypothetical protein
VEYATVLSDESREVDLLLVVVLGEDVGRNALDSSMNDRRAGRVEDRDSQDRPPVQLGMRLGVPLSEEPLERFRSAEVVDGGTLTTVSPGAFPDP